MVKAQKAWRRGLGTSPHRGRLCGTALRGHLSPARRTHARVCRRRIVASPGSRDCGRSPQHAPLVQRPCTLIGRCTYYRSCSHTGWPTKASSPSDPNCRGAVASPRRRGSCAAASPLPHPQHPQPVQGDLNLQADVWSPLLQESAIKDVLAKSGLEQGGRFLPDSAGVDKGLPPTYVRVNVSTVGRRRPTLLRRRRR